MSARIAQVSALLRTLVFAALFIAGALVYLPWALRVFHLGINRSWRWLGLVPLLAGSYVVLRCAFAFAWQGLGTPAPFDAPRRLVLEGMYRYVRNPMYVGALLVLIGQAILFGSGRTSVAYVATFAVVAHLFVVLYEEPALRRKFGTDYDDFIRHVPRWVPRRTAWRKADASSAS